MSNARPRNPCYSTMKDNRFLFGLIATLAWLCFGGYMMYSKPFPVDLNLWGDFFAGFFAPLAFLWLVLGYLQQGEELQQSTEALRLQAEELKNSVEQQSQLVAVSREQMRQEYEALVEERERRRDAARPKFVPQHSGTSTSDGSTTYKLKIANVGNTATRFRMRTTPPLAPENLNLALVARDQVVPFDFRFGESGGTTAVITYIDADGLPGEVRFQLRELSGHVLEFGEVQRLA